MFCFGRRAERQPEADGLRKGQGGAPELLRGPAEDPICDGKDEPDTAILSGDLKRPDAERPQGRRRARGGLVQGPTEDAVSDLSSDGKYELDMMTFGEFALAGGRDLKYIDSDRQDGEEEDVSEEDSSADPEDVFLAGALPLKAPDVDAEDAAAAAAAGDASVPLSSVSSDDSGNLRVPEAQDGGASSASTAEIGRLLSTSSHRSYTSVESTNYSTADLTNLIPEGSPTQGRSPAPGPRFKLLYEGDIHVCRLNHTRTVISKMLSSKFLRRWEHHHLYLNQNCISSKTPTGFFEKKIMYFSIEDIYAVTRWDANYKYCLRIVLSDGSLLLQAKTSYTRDHWFNSIVWKRNMCKYYKILQNTDDYEVVLKELKNMVDFATMTPLQDERVTYDPLDIITKIICEKKWPDEGEMILIIAGPIMGGAPLPAPLAEILSRMCSTRPLSQSLKDTLHHIARRILKHNVDFGKAPYLRYFLQSYISALYQSPGGTEVVRAWVNAVHGPGFNCPHPRVLPNLASACLAAFHSIYPTSETESDDLSSIIPTNITCDFNDLPTDINTDMDAPNYINNNDFDSFESSHKVCDKSHYNNKINKEFLIDEDPEMICFAKVILFMSSYADWAEGLGAVLQPVPIPTKVLQSKEAASALALATFKLGTDQRCAVHQFILPLRQGRPGWLQILCPTHSNPDPDRLQQWGEILDTLLNCCCKRKYFLVELAKLLPACLLLALRAHPAGLLSLRLMLEWEVLEEEQSRVEVVQALRSTPSGKKTLQASCQRQVHLRKLQRKGGPRRLTLPSCATDADVSLLLSAGSFGNLECLSLAFTHVTSAVAEELIKLPSLRYLNLWATQFGDAGLLLIAEHLNRLQVLNLCETPVSDIGIAALSALSSLRKLNLNSTKLSAATWASLQLKLPALQESDIRYTDAW